MVMLAVLACGRCGKRSNGNMTGKCRGCPSLGERNGKMLATIFRVQCHRWAAISIDRTLR